MVKKSTDENLSHEDVSRVYRRAENEIPPARLDAAVLHAARAAVASRRPLARSPFSSAWAVPVSVAAVLMLSVALVVFMSHERADSISPPLSKEAATVTAEKDADTEMRTTATPGPEPVTPPTPAADDRRAESPVASRAKAAAPQAPAAAASRENDTSGTSKLLSKTTPAQNAQSREESIAATAASQLFPDVVSVQAQGTVGAYDFMVQIHGAGSDCNFYVDWWEVLSEDGRLLYRRVLSPGDAKERSVSGAGGPVRVDADAIVWVRVHSHPSGYGRVGFKGSPRTGFRKTEMPPDFAAEVANSPPLPGRCNS
jgi:hypothetical protein